MSSNGSNEEDSVGVEEGGMGIHVFDQTDEFDKKESLFKDRLDESFQLHTHHQDIENSVSPFEIPSFGIEDVGKAEEEPKEAVLAGKTMRGQEFVETYQEQIDLRLASSSNPTAVMELDMDGNVRYLSRNWEIIVGTNIKKIIDKPISQIIIGNDSDDLNVFNKAIDQMIQYDGSYKVKFVTATNDRSVLSVHEVHSSGHATPCNSAEDLSEGNVEQDREELQQGQKEDEANDESSSMSSKLSNNGELIELEAQGILVYDSTAKVPSHSMWTIKPFVHIDLDLTLPDTLIDLLGFGAEIFEGYLLNLKELGIIDEDSVPQPKSILCRICEQNVPAWFIEKHSDLCIVENRLNEDLQSCHDAISDHRELIIKISETLWQHQISQQGGYNSSSSPSSSSSSSLALTSSTSSSLLEYKGLPLPNPSTGDSPRSSNLLVNKNASTINTMLKTKKFPFGILQRLIELCDDSLQINPVEADGLSELLFSPNTEKAINSIKGWKVLETSDPAIRAIVEDTQALVNEKMNALTRLISILQYSGKIKKEVDELVLMTVRDTVAKIKEQTMVKEQVDPMINVSEDLGDSATKLTEQSTPELGYSSKNISPNKEKQGILKSPQPSRTRSPIHNLLPDSFIKDNLENSASVTPKDILLRGRPHNDSSEGISPSNSAFLPNSRPSSRPNSRNASKESNLIGPFQDLDLRRKSAEALSNNSSYSSPRRHLSPAPYVERLTFSSFQRNTNSRLETQTPQSSPRFANAELYSDYSDKPIQPFGRRSNSSGTPQGNQNLSLNLSQHSSKNPYNKPPLSPLLVSLTTPSKPSSGSIKDYEVIKAISKGAFGSVFLAKRKLTGDYVAIKCLKKRDMIAKNQILNVRSERAVMMRQTDSPYVAQLYCSFQTKDYLYLVMEYLNGGDCATLLKVLGTLGDEWAKRYIAECIIGVDDLHKRGIIHRDLKPDNLLIDSKGHLKLTDFGLSRLGVVGRQSRDKRKSSTSDQAIEIFRRSFGQAGNTSTSLLSGTNDSPLSDSSNHRRSTSDNSFTLSPTLDNNKLLTPGSGINSSSLTSPGAAFIDSFQQDTPQVQLQLSHSISNRHNSMKNTGRSGSATSSIDSPLLKPILPRTTSESSFSLVEDDNYLGQYQSSAVSYALFDPENESSGDMKKFVGTPDYLAPETIEGVGQSEASDWWSLGCILFEFLFGYPPFHADSPAEVFKKILGGKIDWPPLSPEEEAQVCPPLAKDLINKLLTLDVESRLGYNGADEIKQHPYFKGINWDTLLEEIPTFIPLVEDPESTSYFDPRGADLAQFPQDDFEEDVKSDLARGSDSPLGEPVALTHSSNTLSPDYDVSSTRNSSNPNLGGLLGEPTNQGKRERRGSRLADPSEFGSFHFRNLNVLEKANKDIINKLKNEHLEHRNSFSSSSSETMPNFRSRGFSFSGSGSINNSGSPFKRPVSPVTFLNHRTPSPNKFEKDFQGTSSPRSSVFRHERGGSAISANSADDPFELAKGSSNTDSAKSGSHKSSIHSLSRRVFKSPNEYSPSSSDTEDSKSLALMRVRRRRESSRRQGSSGGLFSPNDSTIGNEEILPKLNELDILYCEPIPIIRHAVVKLLESLGCIVLSVSDGDELIRRATSQVKFDIIFTAIKLSKVEASDAVKLIKFTSGKNSTTPIVAITGFAKEANEMKVFDSVLEKPVTKGMLKKCLNDIFYRSLMQNAEAIESDGESASKNCK